MAKLNCECGKKGFKNLKSLSNHKRWHNPLMYCKHPIRTGRFVRKDGYIYIYCQEHPNKISGNYVMEHRLVMEKHLKRYLKPEEKVHHINGNRQDNRVENLKICSQSEHCKIESFGFRNKGQKQMPEHIENRRKVVIESGVYKGTNNPNYRSGRYVKTS